ncbi:2-oxoglutarate oxidoreductase [Streptomyces sp. NL15-2K]|nr:2-oxoglutarate oxidoreductase [Streptomyces sp. NL15-2K]
MRLQVSGEAGAVSGRLRGLLTSIHPALERVLGPRLRHPAVLALLQTFGSPTRLRQPSSSAESGSDRRRGPPGRLVHDAHPASPTTAFVLSRLADPDTLRNTPIGVFWTVERPVYGTLKAERLDTAVERQGEGDLAALLAGGDTWTVVG